MMAFVSVPKDLTKVKNKIILNLTKRQLICFGLAAAVGVPFYFLTREVPRMIREGRLLSLNQTGYFLTEFSFGIEQEEMDEMLHDLMELGVTPVIAHPERYRCVQESESGIAKWKNRGCLLQVNRGSIFGRFGSGAKQCVDRLLDQHMVTCIASDAHKPYERTTYMADIKEYMEQEYSFEYSKKLLYDNPKRILEGEKVVQ